MKKLIFLIFCLNFTKLFLMDTTSWVILDQAQINAIQYAAYQHPEFASSFPDTLSHLVRMSIFSNRETYIFFRDRNIYVNNDRMIQQLENLITESILRYRRIEEYIRDYPISETRTSRRERTLKNKKISYVQIETGCHHFFHKDCLNRWLLQNSRCPLCRTTINRKKIAGYVPQDTSCCICLENISTVKKR
ncbi:hypothetical protein A3F66_02265 [candidate division TM6 bacterium RIFCSPHIGHO2_12_FULL_32_22]|nr:MAG: hypothetical protein A3F66_02265 [candidate division TM6 bacterium RIFCSPHIGHO2_12_FULL_32_22]